MIHAKRMYGVIGRVVSALAVAVVLGGCVPSTIRIIGENRAFPGLASFLHEAWDSGRPLHVVLVHGMAHGDPAAPDEVGESRAAADVTGLLESLLTEAPEVTGPSCVARHVREGRDAGVSRYTFDIEGRIQIESGAGDATTELTGSIHFHEINFASYLAFEESPYSGAVSEQEKRRLFEEDIELNATAAYGNRFLKERIVNWGLADAATYLDRDKRDEITAQMADAIRGIFDPEVLQGHVDEAPSQASDPRRCDAPANAPASAEDVRVVFITESLGSKVLFDSLARMYSIERGDERATGVQILVGSQAVYMLANQIPLLELGTELDARYRWEDIWSTDLGQEMVPDKLYLVAFSDPNDLLTFRIAPTVDRYHSVWTTLIPVDVVTPIARNWFGLFAMPTTAHQGHLSNPAVVDMLVRGLNWPP